MADSNYVLVAAAVVLIGTAVFIFLQQSSRSMSFVPGLGGPGNKTPTFIICGPCNSGKTTFFHWLTSSRVVSTVMSQEPNVTTRFPLPSTMKGSSSATQFKLCEFPGHAKLQSQLLDEIRSSTNIHGLVFMVDATADPAKLTEAAHMLYKVLSVSERRPGGVDVLVACNKTDLFSARQPQKIKETLESEINNYRRLQTANVAKVGVEEEEEVELGVDGSFRFEQLDGNFDVAGGSVLKQKTERWENWLDERSVNF